MLTSARHRADAQRCRQLGVAAYLLKPIRQLELRHALTLVLGTDKNHMAIPPLPKHSLPGAGAPHRALSILVAEDNLVNQRLIARMLEKRGHRVTIAADGSEAVDLAGQHSFDLVLMDIQMPKMDGLAATAAIRERERKSGTHLPIVALTVHAMKGDEQLCMSSGMDGYLCKPIRPQELDAVLMRIEALQSALDPVVG